MNSEEDVVRVALEACDKLGTSLDLIGEAVKAARAPIDNDEWDFVTICGELTDMQEYLFDARQMNRALRGSVVDLIQLIKRLQGAYRLVYQAWEQAQQQVHTAQYEGELNMLRRFITDLDQQSLELLGAAANALGAIGGEERLILQEQLRGILPASNL